MEIRLIDWTMISGFCKYTLFSLTGLLFCFSAVAQSTKKPVSLKDSLDAKFDLSDYIIEENGFVPVPYIITEPALGGFGLALFPVFIKKRPPYRDSVKGELRVSNIPPDITGGGALYTVNNTWGGLLFRSGTFIRQRIKYISGGGYMHINMDFYKTTGQAGEKKLAFTIDALPVLLQATKRLGYSNWYAGLKYLFLSTKVSFNGDSALRKYTDTSATGNLVSQLGIIVELDKRDNVFTPDRGIKLHFDFNRSDHALGSDDEFWRLNYYGYWYQPISPGIIGALRLDGKQSFGDPPFYMVPYIEMRGIPAERYQGSINLLSEMEIRKDIKNRWSIMMFGGTAKAFNQWNEFKDADWIFSYGTGFRYLLARKFKLRTGIDIAHGPGIWAYYIVFGSNWLK
jgi:hypothetical protein